MPADAGAAGQDAGVQGAHCAPGTTYYINGDTPSWTFVEDPCGVIDVDNDGSEERVTTFALPEAMVAGQDYAFSMIWDRGWVVAEIWGTDMYCGEPKELLASGRIETNQISCFTLTPTNDHEHMLVIWQEGGGAQGAFTLCPSGQCAP